VPYSAPSDVWPPPPGPPQPELDMFTELALEKYKPPREAAMIVAAVQSVHVLTRIWIVFCWLSGSSGTDSTVGSLVVFGVPFVAWASIISFLNVTYANAAAFGTGGLSTTPGRVVSQSILPWFFFYRPWAMMQEVWKASDPTVRRDPLRPAPMQDAPSSALITIWWITYIVGALAARTLYETGTAAGTVGATFGLVVPAVLSIMVVNAVAARQEAKVLTLIEPAR
jgi:hypothetical protein